MHLSFSKFIFRPSCQQWYNSLQKPSLHSPLHYHHHHHHHPLSSSTSSSNEELIKHTTKLQQYNSFLLFAIHHFQKHHNASFAESLEYFESHRMRCVEQLTDIGIADTALYTEMLTGIGGRAARNNNNNNNNRSHNNNNNNNNHNTTRSSRSTSSSSKQKEECGYFNSYKGCVNTADTCTKKHICSLCQKGDHSKTKCAKFVEKNKTKNN